MSVVQKMQNFLFAYLVRRPGAFVDAGVQTIVPPLPALVSVARADHCGHLAPAGAVFVNGLEKPLVLLFRPSALFYRVRDTVVPPLTTIFVVPSRKMGSYLVPADRASLRGLCTFNALVLGPGHSMSYRLPTFRNSPRQDPIFIRRPHLPRFRLLAAGWRRPCWSCERLSLGILGLHTWMFNGDSKASCVLRSACRTTLESRGGISAQGSAALHHLIRDEKEEQSGTAKRPNIFGHF